MSAILEAKDKCLPRVRGAPATVGFDSTLATKATAGSARGQLVPLPGFSNPDRKPETTLPVAASPPTVAAIPPEVGPASFDYTALKPDDAEFLRKGADRIRDGIKSTMGIVCMIGANLCRAKEILPHGQFVQWLESECRFSLRAAENYIRASLFAVDKFATVANLSPAVMYLVSAKNAPPEVVKHVLARAANGELVTRAEVTRMFRAAKAGQKRLASKAPQNKSRRAGPRHEGSPATPEDANSQIARANARALFERLGRDGAALLLGMRESIVETLSFLAQEIDNPDGADEAAASTAHRLNPGRS